VSRTEKRNLEGEKKIGKSRHLKKLQTEMCGRREGRTKKMRRTMCGLRGPNPGRSGLKSIKGWVKTEGTLLKVWGS